MKLTMEQLTNAFEAAKERVDQYIAVMVRMEGFPEDEYIINEFVNFESKLAYYQKTYDANCNHKFAPGIAIIAVASGDTFSEIEEKLIG